VADAAEAYRISTANGAEGVLPPATLQGTGSSPATVISEIKAYGDVVIRFVSGDQTGPFLPSYETIEAPSVCYGLQRLDHLVGNVPNLLDSVSYLRDATGAYSLSSAPCTMLCTSVCNLRLIADEQDACLWLHSGLAWESL
jgi:4-hydroxyphenylpyruvate dioxygenase